MPSHGGRGYGAELARRMLAFGFGDAPPQPHHADVALENMPCIRVLEKIGMHREGVVRECIFAQGRWWTEATVRDARIGRGRRLARVRIRPILTSA